MVKRMAFWVELQNTNFYSLSLSPLFLFLNYPNITFSISFSFSPLFLSHYHLQSAEVRLLSGLLLTVLTELNICFPFVFLLFKCVWSLSRIWVVVGIQLYGMIVGGISHMGNFCWGLLWGFISCYICFLIYLMCISCTLYRYNCFQLTASLFFFFIFFFLFFLLLLIELTIVYG